MRLQDMRDRAQQRLQNELTDDRLKQLVDILRLWTTTVTSIASSHTSVCNYNT